MLLSCAWYSEIRVGSEDMSARSYEVLCWKCLDARFSRSVFFDGRFSMWRRGHDQNVETEQYSTVTCFQFSTPLARLPLAACPLPLVVGILLIYTHMIQELYSPNSCTQAGGDVAKHCRLRYSNELNVDVVNARRTADLPNSTALRGIQ